MSVRMELVCDGKKCIAERRKGPEHRLYGTFEADVGEVVSELRWLAQDAGWASKTTIRKDGIKKRDLCPDCAEAEGA